MSVSRSLPCHGASIHCLYTPIAHVTGYAMAEPKTPDGSPPRATSRSLRTSRSPARRPARGRPTPCPRCPVQPETVVVIDFGSQFSMLIARRVRECRVYCEIVPPRRAVGAGREAEAARRHPLRRPGERVRAGRAADADWVFEKNLPVLGICYGMQALAHQLGGKVVAVRPPRVRARRRASGRRATSPLFDGLPRSMPVWMSHGDRITQLPPGFHVARLLRQLAATPR